MRHLPPAADLACRRARLHGRTAVGSRASSAPRQSRPCLLQPDAVDHHRGAVVRCRRTVPPKPACSAATLTLGEAGDASPAAPRPPIPRVFRTAEATGQDIIDPRETRAVLCETSGRAADFATSSGPCRSCRESDCRLTFVLPRPCWHHAYRCARRMAGTSPAMTGEIERLPLHPQQLDQVAVRILGEADDAGRRMRGSL